MLIPYLYAAHVHIFLLRLYLLNGQALQESGMFSSSNMAFIPSTPFIRPYLRFKPFSYLTDTFALLMYYLSSCILYVVTCGCLYAVLKSPSLAATIRHMSTIPVSSPITKPIMPTNQYIICLPPPILIDICFGLVFVEK